MKRFLVVMLLVIPSLVHADVVDRIDYSNVDFSFYNTTGIVPVSPPAVSNIRVSSGVVRILGVYVSSPGVNSDLRLYDNILAGDTSNQIGIPLDTNARDFIPVYHETTRGLVITSTRTAAGNSVWSAPSFNIIYRRVR